MDLATKIEFNEVYRKFQNENASIRDVSLMITIVKDNHRKLSEEQITELLNIPLYVLENNVKLKNYTKDEGIYFSGNMLRGNAIPELRNLGTKFESGIFGITEFVDLLKFCIENQRITKDNLNFYLRNPEVALRDDAYVINENIFKEQQNVFASILKKHLEI